MKGWATEVNEIFQEVNPAQFLFIDHPRLRKADRTTYKATWLLFFLHKYPLLTWLMPFVLLKIYYKLVRGCREDK